MMGEPTTHYPGCWRDPVHWRCAVHRVELLRALLVRVLDNPKLCDDPVWQQEAKDVLLEEQLPAVIVKPGEILREEMKARGMSPKDFGDALCYLEYWHHVRAIPNDLLSGDLPISNGVAICLTHILPGISAEFWTNLQATYDRRTGGKR